MTVEIDHIVLGAASLAQGVAYISDLFGVDVPKGGEHLQMGTHNCVMSLGPGCYFEIIAIAPHLDAPHGPRWFDLDNTEQRARLEERPRLLTWVVRTQDLGATLSQTSENVGDIKAMQRGEINWQLTVRSDGRLPFSGLCPSVIEWQNDAPPLGAMENLGCELKCITLTTPEDEALKRVLSAIGADHLATVVKTRESTNKVKVEFATPRGSVMLD